MMQGNILVIAGSDSGGGAGIQADIKTITIFGGYASTAITALTAQNTQGVFAIHDVPPKFITQQIDVILSDIGADVIKIGMLNNAETIHAASDILRQKAPGIPIILDPVMMAKGGHALLEENAITSLKTELMPMAYLVTPNIPEAEILADMSIANTEEMEQAGQKIMQLGAKNVLVKGGHLKGDFMISDVLVTPERTKIFQGPRLDSTHTHGTGCTLASAIAAGVAQKLSLVMATEKARDYIIRAIKHAPGLGKGNGPLGFVEIAS